MVGPHLHFILSLVQTPRENYHCEVQGMQYLPLWTQLRGPRLRFYAPNTQISCQSVPFQVSHIINSAVPITKYRKKVHSTKVYILKGILNTGVLNCRQEYERCWLIYPEFPLLSKQHFPHLFLKTIFAPSPPHPFYPFIPH